MSQVRKVFEKHLEDVRKLAKGSQEHFINVLANLIQGETPKVWNGPGAGLESALIEIYRLEFYEWSANSALEYANANLKQQRGRKKGGAATRLRKKAEGEATIKEIHARADKLLQEGRDKKDIAGIIGAMFDRSQPTIYKALKSHPSGLWQKQ